VIGDGILQLNTTMTFVGNNTGATQDCIDVGYPEVWIKFTTQICMDVTIDYCGTFPLITTTSCYHTKLYTACPCGPGVTRAAATPNCLDGNRGSVWYSLPAGTYWYPIKARSGCPGGPYNVNVTGSECLANNDCSGATAIGEVTDYAFSTTRGTHDGAGTCAIANNIWYLYTASFTGTARIKLSNTNYSAIASVYNGSSCSPLPTRLYCGTDSNFSVVQNNSYLVEIGASIPNPPGGNGQLTINEVVPPPANDSCQYATVIGEVTDRAFSTTYATFDGNGFCQTAANIW
jgi:hypothetical protein